MSQFWRLVGEIRRYRTFTLWGIMFHALTALLTVVSIPLVIPFFQILFGQGSSVATVPDSFWDLEGQLQFYFSDLIVENGTEQALVVVCFMVVVVFGLKNLCRFLISYFMIPVRNGVLRDLRSRIWQQYETISLADRIKYKQGYLMSLITNDLSEVDHGILKVFELLFKTPLIVLGSLLMMLWLSPKLTLIAFILIIFTVLIVGGISHVLKRQSAVAQGALSGISSIVDEYLTAFRAIRAYNAGAYFRSIFQKENAIYYKTTTQMLRRRDLASPLAEFLGVITIVALLYAGAHIVMDNELQPSTFSLLFLPFIILLTLPKVFLGNMPMCKEVLLL